MKLGLTLASLLLSFNLASVDYLSHKIDELYKNFEVINNISRDLKFQDFQINIRKKKINHVNYPNLYFLVKEDHNGKPLYLLRYDFMAEDVQPYFKILQRTPQRRAVK